MKIVIISKKNQSLDSKSAFVGVKWLLLFISTLISVLLIFPPLSNVAQIEEDSLMSKSSQIQNYLLLEEKIILEEISRANAKAQEILLSDKDVNINSYDSELDYELKKRFSGKNYELSDSYISFELSSSLEEIEIKKNLEFSKYQYRDEFFSQYSTLKELGDEILTKQKSKDSCYQGEFNEEQCHSQIIQALNLESSVTCMTSLESENSIECVFSTVPFTNYIYELPAISYQEDRRKFEIPSNFLVTKERDAEVVLSFSKLTPDVSDSTTVENNKGYFLFLFTKGSRDELGVEEVVDEFETLIKIEQDASESYISTTSLETRIENAYEENRVTFFDRVDTFSTGLFELYTIEINNIDERIYFLTAIESASQKFNDIDLSKIEESLGLDSINSILITENRYFNDVSMYERGQLFEIPTIEEETQNNNE